MGHEKALDKVLKEIGIERDAEGKIILYHATIAKNLAGILNKDSIAPAEETGERAWRHEVEKGEKEQKVYLANEKKVEAIARSLQNEYGGSAFILEAHVDENNLFPDEDTGTENWFESLAVSSFSGSNFGGSCSHKGRINNFYILKKLDYVLPKRQIREHYFRKALEIPREDKKAHENLLAEQEEERKTLALEEGKILEGLKDKIKKKQKYG